MTCCLPAGLLQAATFERGEDPGDEVIAALRARPTGARARRAPWVRKNGNLSMREILVKAREMARGRVRLRRTAYGVRRTSPQMTFLHEVVSLSATLIVSCLKSLPNQRYDSVKLSQTEFFG